MNSNDIRAGLKKLLQNMNPVAAVYENNLPRGFVRPSYLIETIRTRRVKASAGLISIAVEMSITCFAQVDAFGNSPQTALVTMQDDVMALFDSGYLPVGERSPLVSASAAGINPGESYVDLTVQYSDEPKTKKEEYETMADVAITTTIKED